MPTEWDFVYAQKEKLRGLLREARQYVADAGSDEDPEAQRHSAALLARIDAEIGDAVEQNTRPEAGNVS